MFPPRTEIKEWFTVRAKELESMNYTEKQIKRIILAAIRCSVVIVIVIVMLCSVLIPPCLGRASPGTPSTCGAAGGRWRRHRSS